MLLRRGLACGLARTSALRVPVRFMGHGPRSVEEESYKLYTQFIPKEWIEKVRA